MIATAASWDAFRARLEKFRYDAPFGAYKKLDHQIEQVKSRRGSTADVVKLRKALWRAAYVSALQEDDRLLRPVFRDEAAAYLSKLRTARTALIEASHAETDHIFRALHFVPEKSDDLSQHLSRQMVEREFVRLNALLGAACQQLDLYLERNVLAPRKKKGREQQRPFHAGIHRVLSHSLARGVWIDRDFPRWRSGLRFHFGGRNR